jgi:outer membrane protein assembly factor BamD (BamD/ComL family)
MESDIKQSADVYKLWAWYEINKKQVAVGGVIVVVVGLVAWFFLWNASQKEINAGEALSAASLPQLTGAGQGADGFLQVAAKYPKSSAGTRAILLAGGQLYAEGKYPEAQAQFERFRKEHSDSPLLSQALLGIAACHEAQGRTNEAVTAYKELVERHPGENVVHQARFALARLYEGQNKPELAKPQLEDIARTDANTSLANEAGMRLEEMRLKYPNLFPAPPAAPMPGALANPGVPKLQSLNTTTQAPPPARTNPAPIKLESK